MKLQITPTDVLNLIGQITIVQSNASSSQLREALSYAHQTVEEYFKTKIDFEIAHPSPKPPYFPPEQS